MTRTEIVKLLKIIRAAYPTAKIADPEGMVAAWELVFGKYDATVIYKAARWHMQTSVYFPTMADILRGINRGDMLYGTDAQAAKNGITATKNAIAAPKRVSVACDGSCICPYFESDICFGTAAEMKLCCL